MKTVLKSIFAFILSAFMFTSCQKETVNPGTAQLFVYVSVDSDASSVITNITVDNVKLDVVMPSLSNPAIHNYPFKAGDVAILELNSAAGKESVISVSLQYVDGETIAFTDSFGKTTFTTFEGSSDKGLVTTNLKVGFGTIAPVVKIYKVLPANLKLEKGEQIH